MKVSGAMAVLHGGSVMTRDANGWDVFTGTSCDCGAGNRCCPGLSGSFDQDGSLALLSAPPPPSLG